MQGIRNIRWIDLNPGARLTPTQLEGVVMNMHKVALQSFHLPKALRAPAPGLLRQAWHKLQRWNELARQRRQLAALGDDMLKDIGRSRADIEREANRPFWDDPDRQ